MTTRATTADRFTQAVVLQELEAAWTCEVKLFGPFCALDYYLLRDGRMVAVAELKARTHPHGTYPTVFLSLRKWLALTLASVGMGVPALFVVRFTDGAYWLRVGEVDASAVRVAGRYDRGAANDVEPIIQVPLSKFRPVAKEA